MASSPPSSKPQRLVPKAPRETTVMVIAGGVWQVDLIQRAKGLGYRVVNTNLYPDSPGFAHADVGVVADVLDREANLAIAREHTVDAVVTDQSDIAVPTVAFVAAELGLPSIGPDVAARFTDKGLMRELTQRAGFPTLPFALCASVGDANRAAAAIGFPLVVKPPQSQSSRGVTIVRHPDELPAAVDGARDFAGGRPILVERFIAGTEHTVEGVVVAGRHHTLSISEKLAFPDQPTIARRLTYRHRHPGRELETLRAQHDRLVESLGLPFGLTHAEYIDSPDGWILIEVAARGGGTRISSRVVPAMTGVDTQRLLLSMSLGYEPEDPQPTESTPEVVALDFHAFVPGVIADIQGVERARALPGVLDLEVNMAPGDEARPAEDDRSRHAHAIVHARDEEQLQKTLEEVWETLEVTYV